MSDEERIEWLKSRQAGIGGSDAAGVCGVSKWSTPYDVYLSKTEPVEDDSPTDAMRWGTMKEPLIRQEYCNQSGNEVVEPKTAFKHEKYPWMIANLDGLVLMPNDPDRVVVFEAKTARDGNGWGVSGSDEVPFDYILQVQHYMLVVGASETHLAVLIGSSDFRIYFIDADPEMQDELIKIEAEFWKQVELRNPPPPKTIGDVQKRYPKNNGDMVESRSSRDAMQLAEIKNNIKRLEKEAEAIELILKKEIADHDGLEDQNGNVLATWKAGKPTKRLNYKRMQDDLPKICEPYIEETNPTRRFLLKVKAEK
jgi:putative phage-type endonuclease